MCECGVCRRCKERKRLQKFRLNKKGITELTDEEFESKLNDYYAREADPDYYKLRVILYEKNQEYNLPSWARNSLNNKKWRNLRATT